MQVHSNGPNEEGQMQGHRM